MPDLHPRPKSARPADDTMQTIWWLLAVIVLGVATFVVATMYMNAADDAAVLRIERDLYQCQLTWGVDDPYCTARYDEAMQRLESNRL